MAAALRGRAAALPAAPADAGARLAAPPEARLRTEQSVHELLTDGGFGSLRFTETAHRCVFARPEQLWDWLWSAGMRGMMESIAPQDHDDARAVLAAVVAERLRGADGTLGWTTGIRITTAERP